MKKKYIIITYEETVGLLPPSFVQAAHMTADFEFRFAREYYTGKPRITRVNDQMWFSVGLSAYIDELGNTKYEVTWADYNESNKKHTEGVGDSLGVACEAALHKEAELCKAHAHRISPEGRLERAKKEHAKLIKKAAKKGYKSGWVFFQLKDIFGYEVADAICVRNVI